ncbi:hypothetical protein F5144DRAFT_487113 [Chaetomium tenue]|uniref:Uncharacterized protein n=1 Tax=Chaetomium tenue TaxID=1854479 RepID=A0ACB7PD46_9PEZI|nr:hypothetical protein F5144DRAFT_487113 [Chaetomium globosum]
MTSLIDERFLVLGVKEPTEPDQKPFWLLARRPARSVPRLFPLSTHQIPATGPGTEGEFSSAVDSPVYSMSDTEMEIMPLWTPQDLSIGGPDNGVTNMNPAMPQPLPGRYIVSRGDALLLNIMDCQRTSSDEWMDLLQKQSAGDASGTLTDADGEVSEYNDASESGSAEEMWNSEDEEESPMALNMLSQRSGAPVRP